MNISEKTGKKALAFILSLVLSVTLIPELSFADNEEASGETEYAVCTYEYNSETGEKVLCPSDDELGDDVCERYIGEETEICLACRTCSGDDWTEMSEAEAGAFKIEWSAGDSDGIEFQGETENSAKVKFIPRKEKDAKPARITAVLTSESGEPQITAVFFVYVYDGYNPGFDPDDSDEVISMITEAKKAGKVNELKNGYTQTSEIKENDGLAIFSFSPENSRYYSFSSIGDLSTYGYFYELNVDVDEKDVSCMLLTESSGEDRDGNFLITGGLNADEGQYEEPLDTFEGITYYVIAKFYKSSSIGPLTVRCDKVTTTGIFDSILRYYQGEETDIEKEEINFSPSAATQEYVYDTTLPYDCRWDRGVTLTYTDSREKTKTVRIKKGRNVVAVTGENRYVVNVSCEKKSDELFEVNIVKYLPEKEDVIWEGETLSGSDFSESNEAVLHVPRNSEGIEYTIMMESLVSSELKLNEDDDDPDMDKEIFFTYSGGNDKLSFLVSTADKSSWKKYTVVIEEDDDFEIEQLISEFGTKNAETGKVLESEDLIQNEDIDESGNMTLYIPYWYEPGEAGSVETDLELEGDYNCMESDDPSEVNTVSSFSDKEFKDVLDSAVSDGTKKTYTFRLSDKEHPEKYSRSYSITVVPTSGKVAALRKAEMEWEDPDTDEVEKKSISFIAGSGEKNDPYIASVRMPEGVDIQRLDYDITLMAFSDKSGVIYSKGYDGGYERENTYAIISLSGESDTEKVDFVVKSADNSTKCYYSVYVHNSDSAYVRGAVFRKNGAVYRVIADGKAEYLKAPEGVKSETVPSKVKGGVSKYSVTRVAQKAFAGCTKLSSVTIGGNVRAIGERAFSGAKKLRTLKLLSASLSKAGVKGSLKGSSVATVKCTGKARKKIKTYKHYFTRANCGKKVVVK